MIPVDVSSTTQDKPDVEATYEENCDLLLSLAVTRFGIPRSDAETLVQQIFLEYLMHSGRVRDRGG